MTHDSMTQTPDIETLTSRFHLLRHLRETPVGPKAHVLLDVVESRLGADALRTMMTTVAPVEPRRVTIVDVSEEHGPIGQVCPDGQGGLWIMMRSPAGRAGRVIRLDGQYDLVRRVDIAVDANGQYFADQHLPLWFDSDSLRFMGPNGPAGLDFSVHARLLGPHVNFVRMVRLGEDEVLGLFTTMTGDSNTLLHVVGDQARVFMPPGIRLPHDLQVLGDAILFAEHENGWVHELDLQTGSATPYLEMPMSCLLQCMASGPGETFWVLTNAGHSLVRCQGRKVTGFVRHLDDLLGEPVMGESSGPVYVETDDFGGERRVILSGLRGNRIYILHFDD